MNNHKVMIVDFAHNGPQTCFVKFSGYDDELKREFTGMVRFVGELPYGDVIHPTKSELSNSCREFVENYLIQRYNEGQFDE
ncbi:hypothetical protein ABE042_09165 [Viridibacillus arvi]|uniref:hypothetical protein n=1 Tax=Viridibacillus arvi TaxID=263475 RepID=UPI003D27D785